MCKHKHALKGKMITGIQRRCSPDPRLTHIQLFPLRWETKSSFHFSRGPATLATSAGEKHASAQPRWEKKDGPECKLSWWQ